MTKNGENQRKSKRDYLKTKVEFYVDADIICSETINISENGVQFETKHPIIVKMRMDTDGLIKESSAKLVWSKQSNGTTVYGLEYISEPKIKFIENYEL